MSTRSVVEIREPRLDYTFKGPKPTHSPYWDAAYLSHEAPAWEPRRYECVTCRGTFAKGQMGADGTQCQWCYKPPSLRSVELPAQQRELSEAEAATRLARRWDWDRQQSAQKHTVTCACEDCV